MTWRAAATTLAFVLVYVVAGPVVGLVVFALGMAAWAGGADPRDMGYVAAFILLYGSIFAHYAGAVWAAVAAAAALLLRRLLGRAPAWIGPATGIVSFLAAVIGGGVQLPAGWSSTFSGTLPSEGTGTTLLMLLVHLAAATACWLLARRIGMGRPAA